ncbi:glycosyltransferase [Maridesulfovibrio hydrothermalis]|uniref:Spore protein YkvP/CgeB glycosyl transferase-like domain-containing protein n=1 Tax=Maridesulfovibrio hydrothermalis AM13 = DSM 14728 TaxID=1121451 RepID=L0RBV1_9BACT|nr:glycosyltransferase [Maridesulfovibrio hydrothermalis]CCO23665.1 conserved protein of unknown function [Maridesulfovibrio hydrothermalis AM13 = DSM 14728]
MNKLLLINCRQDMVNAFIELGCEVRCIRSSGRELDIPAKLAELEFDPDLVFQQEILGLRLFLRGLHTLNCVRIYWSVDTHLNMHWHGLYGSLFDGVLTAHKKYVSSLGKVCDADICWVPWMGGRPGPEIGTGKGIIPYTKRIHDMTFVGRVSKERRSRQWFVDFLNSSYNLYLADGLSYSEMMETYRQTRIVPNEAIFGEINFRLFEACSCGCAMVTPDIGEELGELFEIGKEIEVYNDALELKEILSRFYRDPAYAASMGLAAYERVLRDHLPVNRASRILDFAKEVTVRKIDSHRAELLNLLIDATLGEAGDPAVKWEKLIAQLLLIPAGDQRDTALMRFFARADILDGYMGVARPYLVKQRKSADCIFNMTASLCALKLNQWDIAKHFWYSYSSGKYSENISKPQNEAHLFILWGEELCKCGLSIRSGVVFNERSGIPACGADCFFAALYKQPANLDIYKHLDSIFRNVKGAEPSRLGFLSHLSLHNPDDWRISTEVGITNLKVFRISEGLHELENARKIAARFGGERFFKRKIESELPLMRNMFNNA